MIIVRIPDDLFFRAQKALKDAHISITFPVQKAWQVNNVVTFDQKRRRFKPDTKAR